MRSKTSIIQRLLAAAVLVLAVLRPLAAAEPVVLVVGDSLSAAYGMSTEQGWVSLLEQRLREAGKNYRVVNASISGDTTQGGLSRLPKALEQHRPSVVILELGGNDGLRGINPARMQENLENMVRLVEDSGARTVLLGVRIPLNYGAAYRERFLSAYPAVAEKTGAPLAPHVLKDVAERPELMQADGIHPNAKAQPVIVDNVWPLLEPLL